MRDAAQLPAAVPVAVELGRPLAPLLGKVDPADGLTQDLNALLDELGLRGEALVDARVVDSPRAVRIRLHGRVQPFPPELMLAVWRRVAPPRTASYPDPQALPIAVGFPDAWLAEYAATVSRSRQRLVARYLTELATAVVRHRPACLVGPGQVRAYWHGALAGRRDPPPLLAPVLRRLLDLGFVASADAVRPALDDAGATAECALEEALTRLRPGRIEACVHPEQLEDVAPGFVGNGAISVSTHVVDPDVKQAFHAVAEAAFFNHGIRLHDLAWAQDPALPPGRVRLRVNQRLLEPSDGPGPGEILVGADPEWLRRSRFGYRTQEATHPRTGAPLAIAPEEARPAADALGIATWTPAEYVFLLLEALVAGPAAAGLFSADDIEFELARLAQSFPVLVERISRAYTTREIASVLRELAREGVSVYDLRMVLVRLAELAALESGNGRTVDSSTAYVREGLRTALASAHAGAGALVPVWTLSRELEERVLTGLPEADEERIRDELWRALRSTHLSEHAVVVVGRRSRQAVHRLLAPEFPRLSVLSPSEIRPDLEVYEVGMLALD